MASFAYAPDSSRAGKFSGSGALANADYYLSADTDILVDAAYPSGLATSWLTQDAKREGAVTSWGHKDHLSSNRVISFMAGGQATIWADYGPYGAPLTSNGSQVLNGNAYINQRYDAETGLAPGEYLFLLNYQNAIGYLPAKYRSIARLLNLHGRKRLVHQSPKSVATRNADDDVFQIGKIYGLLKDDRELRRKLRNLSDISAF